MIRRIVTFAFAAGVALSASLAAADGGVCISESGKAALSACENKGPASFNVGAHGKAPQVNFHSAPPPADLKKREQQKFDITSIENALIDRRAPQRQAATGASLNQTASLGAPTAAGPTLSQNEIDALKARLRACWDVPVGMQNARDLIVTVRIHFKRDGSLAADPVVENQSMLPIFRVAAESALRAVRKCAPYTFMPPAKYEAWQDVEVDFDPREMFGG